MRVRMYQLIKPIQVVEYTSLSFWRTWSCGFLSSLWKHRIRKMYELPHMSHVSSIFTRLQDRTRTGSWYGCCWDVFFLSGCSGFSGVLCPLSPFVCGVRNISPSRYYRQHPIPDTPRLPMPCCKKFSRVYSMESWLRIFIEWYIRMYVRMLCGL